MGKTRESARRALSDLTFGIKLQLGKIRQPIAMWARASERERKREREVPGRRAKFWGRNLHIREREEGGGKRCSITERTTNSRERATNFTLQIIEKVLFSLSSFLSSFFSSGRLSSFNVVNRG